MNLRTFRAPSLSDALHLIAQELGPDATVVSTEKKPQGFWAKLTGTQCFEVIATRQSLSHASRAVDPEPQPATGSANLVTTLPQDTLPQDTLPQDTLPQDTLPMPIECEANMDIGSPDEAVGREMNLTTVPPLLNTDYRDRLREFATQEQPESLLEAMIGQQDRSASTRLPGALFRLFTDLLDADVDDDFARETIESVQRNSTPAELTDADAVRRKAIKQLVDRIQIAPPIGQQMSRGNVVALIGPTGVGKTTTIAKLAANLRLRDRLRVGLITVDTYRMAAVDQLRAYAEIIDLPMEVVTTPREMRDAVARLSALDVVLIDTAGRNSHDELQIQELKAMLGEAQADEVHLVLSAVASSRHLLRLAENFKSANPTSLLLTKLDEALELGHLLPTMCSSRLPLSYTTHGQNVPDDIQPADPLRCIERILRSN